MRMLATILSFVFCSCVSHDPAKKLADVDKIQIHWNNGRSLYVSKDANVISIFKEVLNNKAKKQAASSCAIAGYIWLMKGDETRVMVSFSLVMPDCINLTVHQGEAGPYFVYRMTYRAGRFLDDMIHQNKEHVRDN